MLGVALLGILAIYLAYFVIGWLVLNRHMHYTANELRREVAMNGVSYSPSDEFFNFLLALAYLFVLCAWPMAVHRKKNLGHVVGK